jgi:hypothetical protein
MAAALFCLAALACLPPGAAAQTQPTASYWIANGGLLDSGDPLGLIGTLIVPKTGPGPDDFAFENSALSFDLDIRPSPSYSIAAGATVKGDSVSGNVLNVASPHYGDRYAAGGAVLNRSAIETSVTGNSVTVGIELEMNHKYSTPYSPLPWSPHVIGGLATPGPGGYATATGNRVLFQGQGATTDYVPYDYQHVTVYGALITGHGTAVGNCIGVDLTNLVIPLSFSPEGAIGAAVLSGNASGNHVDIAVGSRFVMAGALGIGGAWIGEAAPDSVSDANHVKIQGGQDSWISSYGNIYGTFSAGGSVTGSSVDIDLNGNRVLFQLVDDILDGLMTFPPPEIFGGKIDGDGFVGGNTVNISVGGPGTVDATFKGSGGNLFGAEVTGNGDASGNRVNLRIGGEYHGVISFSPGSGTDIFGARVDGQGTASNNSVDIAIEGSYQASTAYLNNGGGIFGASVSSGKVTGNSVNISIDGEYSVLPSFRSNSADIFGAETGDGDAADNSVSITLKSALSVVSIARGDIFGARASGGDASGGGVAIDVGSGLLNARFSSIFGARLDGAGPGAVSRARVAISVGDGSVEIDDDGEIFGASSEGNGGAVGNEVTVTLTGSGSVSVGGGITGAMALLDGGASGNRVGISVGGGGNVVTAGTGGITGARVAGGSGAAEVNRVDVAVGDGILDTGGYDLTGASVSGAGDASGNAVTVSCTGSPGACSARARDVVGASTLGGRAYRNAADLLGGGEISGDVLGGRSDSGGADLNSVRLGGASDIVGDVIGGRSGSGTADLNSVWLEGASVIAGDVMGGLSGSGSAVRNAVSLEGSPRIAGNVYGGKTDTGGADGNEVFLSGFDEAAPAGQGMVFGGYSASGGAEGNRIAVRDSALSRSLTGGYSGAGRANGNTVTLSGRIEMSPSFPVDLAGGMTGSGYSALGNVLELDRVEYPGAGFRDLGGFEEINVEIPAGNAGEYVVSSGKGKALIPAAGSVALGGPDAVTRIRVNIAGPEVFSVGDRIRAFDSSAPVDWSRATLSITRNLMEYSAAPDGNEFTVTARTPRREAKVLTELPLASAAFVNRGADFIEGQAVPAAAAASAPGRGLAAFAAVGYGWSRTETGSHVDVKGFTGDVGVSFTAETPAGLLTAGAFAEFGDGSFDSYNDFAGLPTVHGEGDVSYIGGGAFARTELGGPGPGRSYLEASARFGRSETDFRTPGFSPNGMDLSYSMSAGYRGFHAGAGHVLPLGGSGASLELSAKYFLTRRDGDEFLLSGDRVVLSPVVSSRTKLGARLNFGLAGPVRGYAGLHWERELDGESRVSYGGEDLPASTLKGSTAVGEMGLAVASPGSPLEVRLGLQGSRGRRDSLSSSLSVRYSF